MERRAAKQAAKKAALQTSDGVRRIQKTARVGENTFKAAKAAVEAAAKTVQSMIAALGAAGAVIVLLHSRNYWRCRIFGKLREQRSTQPGSPFLHINHPEIR